MRSAQDGNSLLVKVPYMIQKLFLLLHTSTTDHDLTRNCLHIILSPGLLLGNKISMKNLVTWFD